ncbi:kinase-like domain-containing protein [Suillus clintonianus]|uniref:kinase-like domain-containing protein n=1 Tax=Suillus clintonianus TaxID=1904413 RepID=UPI001B860EB2|nr:kinase-like domain-containing protein [Suillus clintonianus]KAG2134530.1 kinase-like domain-containing protein [Suillus clintonianus]
MSEQSEQKAESPVSPTRGWSPTAFWEAVRRILPSKPPMNGHPLESGPNTLVCNYISSIKSILSNHLLQDQPQIDIIHHLAASQPLTHHEAEEPIYLHPIDGLPDLSGQIKDKGVFPHSIGGFSDVWKCIWTRIDKNERVAVKAIRIQGDVKDREKKSRRLCQEATIWVTLKNEHILQLLGLTWGFGPLPALVCPWVENGSLNSYLESKQHRDISLRLRFYILQGVVSAVSYLHSQNVVHGDITGSNILINGQGEPLLSDFGLSFLDMELTGNSYFTSCKPGNVLSGRVPYAAWTDYMVISEKFNGTEPPRVPESPIDDRHWQFMRRCWRKKQERSVKVKDIAEFIKKELESR